MVTETELKVELKVYDLSKDFQDSQEYFRSQEVASILHNILLERKADLRRGDHITMEFFHTDVVGYFYDGHKVILPHEGLPQGAGYYGVPSEFKFPTEFPRDYFRQLGYQSSVQGGGLCFDVDNIASVGERIEIKVKGEDSSNSKSKKSKKSKDEGQGKILGYKYSVQLKNSESWVLVWLNYGDVDTSGDEESKILETFLKTGRCYHPSDAENFVSQEYVQHLFHGMDKSRIILLIDC